MSSLFGRNRSLSHKQSINGPRPFPGKKSTVSAQMRRSLVSIASNISEGSARATRKDFRQFVLIARGSNFELQTQLEIVKRVGMAEEKQLLPLERMTDDVSRMLAGLAQYLAAPANPQHATQTTELRD
ncbi:four helix bundle protein [Terriglobus tenax]|nr:four helix bundle protein [Terriglobus tenax]